jgi:chromosome segregation ATPase
MSKLELAAERLTTALNALEARVVPMAGCRAEAQSARADAADARADAQSARAEAESAKARLAELDAERDGLLARIAELEEEAQILGEISEEIENRLDGAIGEVRAALGR